MEKIKKLWNSVKKFFRKISNPQNNMCRMSHWGDSVELPCFLASEVNSYISSISPIQLNYYESSSVNIEWGDLLIRCGFPRGVSKSLKSVFITLFEKDSDWLDDMRDKYPKKSQYNNSILASGWLHHTPPPAWTKIWKRYDTTENNLWILLSDVQRHREVWELPNLEHILQEVIRKFKVESICHPQKFYLLGHGKAGNMLLSYAPKLLHYLAAVGISDIEFPTLDELKPFANIAFCLQPLGEMGDREIKIWNGFYDLGRSVYVTTPSLLPILHKFISLL